MRKLKVVMSDKNFTNAVVYDEDGEALGYINEVSIRAKRKVLFVKIGGRDEHHFISAEDMQKFREIIDDALKDGDIDRDPFIVFNDMYNVAVGTVELDDYQTNNAKVLAKQDGRWVSEEELVIKDVIE